MTAVAAPRRRFLLNAWEPALGAAVRPVGVLVVGVDDTGLCHAVAWIPGSWDNAAGWRDRLAGADPGQIAAALIGWRDEDSGLRLVEIEPGPTDVDVRTAAEFALDEVLAVLVPLFDGQA